MVQWKWRRKSLFPFLYPFFMFIPFLSFSVISFPFPLFIRPIVILSPSFLPWKKFPSFHSSIPLPFLSHWIRTPFIYTSYRHFSVHILAIFSPILAMAEDSSPLPRTLKTTPLTLPERAWNCYLHVHILILLLLIKMCRFFNWGILFFILVPNF
jgi:hypothetical protein